MTQLASFNQGAIPTIAILNVAKTALGVDLDKLVAALQKQVDRDFAGVWHEKCVLKIVSGNKIPAGMWAIVFLDDADAENALGYHDLTPDGFPLSKVFVKTTIQNGEKVSVTASHELLEMLVDPGIQMGATGPNGYWYAYETADAVEAFTYLIDGVEVSDFVFPSWFEAFRKANSVKFDFLGKCTKPFQILRGGYMPVFKNGRWSQIFGSSDQSFNAATHSRSPRRGVNLKRSDSKVGCESDLSDLMVNLVSGEISSEATLASHDPFAAVPTTEELVEEVLQYLLSKFAGVDDEEAARKLIENVIQIYNLVGQFTISGFDWGSLTHIFAGRRKKRIQAIAEQMYARPDVQKAIDPEKVNKGLDIIVQFIKAMLANCSSGGASTGAKLKKRVLMAADSSSDNGAGFRHTAEQRASKHFRGAMTSGEDSPKVIARALIDILADTPETDFDVAFREEAGS